MRIYFVRHGQTMGNVLKLNQGWGETPITEVGEEQARQTRDLISHIKFDRVYSSDLVRTRQTCEIVFPDRDDVIFDERLREVNNTCLLGVPHSELIEKYGEAHKERHANYAFDFYGGEGREHFKARVADFLRDMEELAKSGECERVAVVTHGGVIHSMESVIYGYLPTSYNSLVSNASVTVIEYSGGEWRIIHWNYTGKIS